MGDFQRRIHTFYATKNTYCNQLMWTGIRPLGTLC